MELMVGAKGLFIAVIISVALVLISLAVLILVSGCYDSRFLAFSWLLAA
jgi:hypothetical protein